MRKERDKALRADPTSRSLLQEFGWDSVYDSDPLLTLLPLQVVRLKAMPRKISIITDSGHCSVSSRTSRGNDCRTVFVLSEFVCPQICFIHGLTSSASQPFNNWRNYQASGSKAPQKCVMPLSKACRKGEEKNGKRGLLIQYSVCTTTHNKTLQCSTYIQRHMHTKLKDRGWWCHKWQALTGRISIPHNSGSPCMSDKFMIPSKCCSPIFLCIKMGVFDVARFHHAVWLVSLIQRMWLTQH